MMSSTPYSAPRVIYPHQSQRGFTLIELMISMVLGLIVLLAIMTLFINVNRNSNEFSKTNILIENGRFTIQLLESDLIHTGFWGGYVPDFDNLTETDTPANEPTGVPDPCLEYDADDATPTNWTDAYLDNLFGIAVQTYDDAASVCAPLLTNKLADTDVLIIRHANTCVPGEANCETVAEAAASGDLYFQQSNCSTEIDAGDSYVLSAVAANHNLTNRDCATLADTRKFISNIYYIRDYATTVGDGIPTLMRSEFGLSTDGTLEHQDAAPLIEGVEGFQVELGIDSLSKTGAAVDYTAAVNWLDDTNKTTPTNRGDGTADDVDDDGDSVFDDPFRHCGTANPCTVDELTDVVTVQLHVLARALEATQGYTDAKTYSLGSTTLGPFNDQFKRHIFSTTVRLQNISGRRETP